MNFGLNEKGTPTYSLYYNSKLVVQPSKLGFTLSEGKQLDQGFQLIRTDSLVADQTWQPVWGEVSNIRNHYKQMSYQLKQTSSGILLNIIFRVFEDGIGFRYEFPRQSNLTYFTITKETTQFNLTGDHKAFWIPGDYDTNEQLRAAVHYF